MALWKRVLCGFALAVIVTVPLYAKVVASGTRTGNQTFQGGNFALQLKRRPERDLVQRQGRPHHQLQRGVRNLRRLALDPDLSRLPGTSRRLAGTSDAFCSDHNDNDSLDGWTTAHYRVVTPNLPLGVHTVQVLASVVGNLNGGGLATGWIGDAVVIVEK